jgi:hypothetical protein
MWDPQRLTTLWASKTCYRESFTFQQRRIANFHLHVRFDVLTAVMWRRVVWQYFINVSEEHAASIFRIKSMLRKQAAISLDIGSLKAATSLAFIFLLNGPFKNHDHMAPLHWLIDWVNAAGCLAIKLLLALASTIILGLEPHRTHDHILLSDGCGSLPHSFTAAPN